MRAPRLVQPEPQNRDAPDVWAARFAPKTVAVPCPGPECPAVGWEHVHDRAGGVHRVVTS